MPTIAKHPLPKIEQQDLFTFLKALQITFMEDRWIPQTTGITHASSVVGWYQRMGRIVFCGARFTSDGALAVAAGATLALPLPPYKRGTVYPFSGHNFEFSNAVAGTSQKCWMDETSGLIKPTGAIGATATNLTFSGWYYTE